MNRALLFVIVLIVGSHGALVTSAKPTSASSASESVASASNQESTVVGSSQSSPVIPVGVVPSYGQQQAQPQSVVAGEYSPHSNHYAPAGIINVAGIEPKRNFEQYGQPEPTGMPANYKPFGSWGLYIGGNPADGYYTNYYKSLSAAVEQQSGSSGVPKPVSPVAFEKQPAVSPMKAFSMVTPVVRYSGPGDDDDDYAYRGEYNFPYSGPGVIAPAHSPTEFGPVVHQKVKYSPAPSPSSSSSAASSSSVESSQGPEIYAKKSVFESASSSVKPKEAKGVSVYAPAQPVYVYGASPYAYASVPAVSVPSTGVSQSVVPYPVPVGSHILGSQPGVEGSFYPYGVHGFTKYVVKPVANGMPTNPGYAAPAVMPVEKANGAPIPGYAAPAASQQVSSVSQSQSQTRSSPSSSVSYSVQQGPVYSPSQFAVANPSYKVQYYPYSPQHYQQQQQQYQYQQYQPQHSYAYSSYPYYSYASGNYYGYPVNQIHYSPVSGEQSLVAMSAAEQQQQQQQQSPAGYAGAHSSSFQHQFGPVGIKPTPSIYVDGKMPVEEGPKSEQPSVEKKAKA